MIVKKRNKLIKEENMSLKPMRQGAPYKTVSRDGKQRHEHTIIAEEALGRPLTKDEVVHHLNEDKTNNSLENLLIVTKAWHKRIHDSIGLATRFKKVHVFTDDEALASFMRHMSAIKAAKELGCGEATVRRAIKRSTGKSCIDIAKENNWRLRGDRTMSKKILPLRQGEVLLYPINKLSNGEFKEYNAFIVGHSETGHHHVLESKKPFRVSEDDKQFVIELFEPAKLVHKKTFDWHNTITIAPGKYRVIYKTEYSPWEKVIRQVAD